MNVVQDLLKQHWGFDSFRPLQEEVIQSVLSGNDTLALMPTGGGKSLCYQVPALAKPGLCLVISPLIALMKDQVENLRRKNITAFAIYSGMSRKEVINTLKVASNSNCKFLYVSPERLETSLFKEYLPAFDINLIAVDEAHCISQWGYDFRPPYLRIAALRDELPDVPVLALTASATPEVQLDICAKLNSPQSPEGNWKIFRQSFERPRLSYSVFCVDSRINKVTEILQKIQGTAIVYCKSRKRTREISELLTLQHISADYYHAGLTQDERNQKQEDWISNKTRVIVCTNAFGMGIDKPDVRTVIHADPPDCLENYYQEAGRAGRDGKMAYAVLLFDAKDLSTLESNIDLRYPSQDDIRIVYQAIANYLQLPAGEGAGNYYDFDLNDFLRKFKLNSRMVLYSLKALEQEGWLAFNEQAFLPSFVQFTTSKENLYSFEKNYPAFEPMIKALLRSYEGIFDRESWISEWVLGGIVKKEIDEVKEELLALHQRGVIEYRPRTKDPQILLLRDRVRSEDLTINMQAYRQRKEKSAIRLKEMLAFIKEQTECRSRIIGAYFGDTRLKSCGVCDNCLRLKNLTMSKEEFASLHQRIISMVKSEALPPKEIFARLEGIKKEKAWKVIEFLQAEKKIDMDSGGKVKLR